MSLLSGEGICLLTNIRTWTRSSIRAIMCPPASLHCSIDSIRYRNFNLLSIAYASPPRLRSRLTLSRRSLLRNPRAFGGKDSVRSPTQILLSAIASVPCLSPGHFRRSVSRPVSYYALFEWWLLLSQHPGCL